MHGELEDLINRRRDRAIAIILRLKEKECDPHLPPEAQVSLRKVVLDQLNETTELALRLLRSLDDDNRVLNERWLEKIESLYDAVVSENGH